MESDRVDLAREIYRVCRITGRFRLRSGSVSLEYFDKYLFESDPRLLMQIGLHLGKLLPPEAQVLAGLELGGIALATVLSQIIGLPLVQVRKKAKEYGTCKQVEGCAVEGQNVVIVEDVVTSGGQIIESAGVLRQLGATIVAVVCVVDRESGAAENLTREGLPFHALFRMSELKVAMGFGQQRPT